MKKDKKKVLIWIKAFSSKTSGGLSYYNKYLIDNLKKIAKRNNADQMKLCIYFKNICKDVKPKWLKTLLVKTNLLGFIWDQLILPVKLRRVNTKIVFFPTWKLPFLKIYSSKEVGTIFDFSPIKSPESHSLLEKLYFRLTINTCIRRSIRIITISKTIKKEIINKYNTESSKIKVVYPDIHPIYKKQINKRTAKQKENYILYVGGYRARKNVENLIKALPYINRKYKLILCGAKNKLPKKLNQLIREANLSRRIIQTERLSLEELVRKYKKASVFVYPSVYEGFGLPPLEAMACGTATAVSNLPIFNETCGNAAIKFNPYNPRDIARKINRLLKDKGLREKLVRRGYRQIKKFSWDKSALSLYKLLLGI
ncbi:glycosyltransferase family 4 protein [bacterium]|nr:glycosyltransferase family 4 protein [bacterium]